jgi:hypothetical protein
MNGCKKGRRGGRESKNELGPVSPQGMSKNKHKKATTTEKRPKANAVLDRLGIEREDWMSFNDILKVCKINEGVKVSWVCCECSS